MPSIWVVGHTWKCQFSRQDNRQDLLGLRWGVKRGRGTLAAPRSHSHVQGYLPSVDDRPRQTHSKIQEVVKGHYFGDGSHTRWGPTGGHTLPFPFPTALPEDTDARSHAICVCLCPRPHASPVVIGREQDARRPETAPPCAPDRIWPTVLPGLGLPGVPGRVLYPRRQSCRGPTDLRQESRSPPDRSKASREPFRVDPTAPMPFSERGQIESLPVPSVLPSHTRTG